MRTNQYTSLYLEGKLHNKAELLLKAESALGEGSIEEWEMLFWQFILDWLSEKKSIIVHTSGSTGNPKSITLLKSRMVNSALATGLFFDLKPRDKAICCLPANYIAGKMMIVRAFVIGLDLILSSPSKPHSKLTSKIEFAAMVPLQVEKVLRESTESINFIKTLIIGGAPVNNDLLNSLQEVNTSCYATYGMTETITHIAIKSLNHTNTDYYKTLPDVDIKLDERGCLVIEAEKISSELVVTNDIVELLSPKTFRWLGRFDNVINSGGVKLFPEKIEKKLSPIISKRFFISSLPHIKLGQQLILIIEEEMIEKKRLLDLEFRIQQCVDKYENPRKIFFIPHFVETPTGKIMRKKTLELVPVN